MSMRLSWSSVMALRALPPPSAFRALNSAWSIFRVALVIIVVKVEAQMPKDLDVSLITMMTKATLKIDHAEFKALKAEGGLGHHRGEGGGPNAEGLGRLAHLVDDLEGFGEGVTR